MATTCLFIVVHYYGRQRLLQTDTCSTFLGHFFVHNIGTGQTCRTMRMPDKICSHHSALLSCQLDTCFAAKASCSHPSEDVPAATTSKSPKDSVGLSHAACQQEVVGLAILPMATPQNPPSSHPTPPSTTHAAIIVNSAQATASTRIPMQHSSNTAPQQPPLPTDQSVMGDKLLWVLPLALLQDQEGGSAHEGDSRPTADQCRALLERVLTGNRSTVCFNMQGQPQHLWLKRYRKYGQHVDFQNVGKVG